MMCSDLSDNFFELGKIQSSVSVLVGVDDHFGHLEICDFLSQT